MSRGKVAGDVCRTHGAWLVTRRPDGMVEREALLTFNPFAVQGRHAHPDGPLDETRDRAWHRERARFQRHEERAEAARRATTGAGERR